MLCLYHAAAEAAPGTPAHGRAMEHKHKHKHQILGWITDLARRTGADEPDRLARTLTLLLDGALSSGALDDGVAAAVREAARLLVRVSLHLLQNAYTGISSWVRCEGQTGIGPNCHNHGSPPGPVTLPKRGR